MHKPYVGDSPLNFVDWSGLDRGPRNCAMGHGCGPPRVPQRPPVPPPPQPPPPCDNQKAYNLADLGCDYAFMQCAKMGGENPVIFGKCIVGAEICWEAIHAAHPGCHPQWPGDK